MTRAEWMRGQWLAFFCLLAGAGVGDVAASRLIPGWSSGPERWIALAVTLLATGLMLLLAFRSLRRIQRELERKNRELQALQQANLDIYGELSLENVLQRVVDQAANLLGARYGALSVIDEEGRVDQFVTSGVSEEERERIGSPPVGKGLLGVSLHEGERLRLASLNSDARSAGLPPHHPQMRSLLAVPVMTEPPFRANLYVSEKAASVDFDADDEDTLARFADQAALAIEKALLHRRLNNLAVAEERARIAREMHDGLAQVLAYVNAKAQAVREYVVAGRAEEATRQLEQLAAAARDVLVEVREGILALRTDSTGERSFQEVIEEYVRDWRAQTGISVATEIPQQLTLDPTVELQLLRIIQESLSNVRKHSGADLASVVIEASGDGLRTTIEDRGIGFDEATLRRKGSPRFGLAIMRERAESVGGTVEVSSVLGRGTTVRVDLPPA